jgi:hypothetical protein
VILELDCLGAVAKLEGKELDRSMQGPLVEEIKELMREFEDIRVTHVRCSCNGVVMSTHASVLVDSVGPPSAEVCRTAASFP